MTELEEGLSPGDPELQAEAVIEKTFFPLLLGERMMCFCWYSAELEYATLAILLLVVGEQLQCGSLSMEEEVDVVGMCHVFMYPTHLPALFW